MSGIGLDVTVGIIVAGLLLLAALIYFVHRTRTASATKKKDDKDTASAAESRYAMLFDLVPYGCAVYDLEDRLLMVNEAYCQRLGLEPKSAVGYTEFELGLFSDAEVTKAAREVLTRTGEYSSREVLLGSVQGVVWALHTARFVSFDDRRYILSTSVDVTSLRRREDSLRSNEEVFNRLFHSAPVPMAYAFDVDGYLATTWNESWYRTFGYRHEEADGRSGAEIGLWVSPLDRQQFIEKIKSQDFLSTLEAELKCRDGSTRSCEIYGRFIGRPGQQILVAAYLDISERKHAEEEREKLQQRLSLSQKLESVGQLAGGVAHDYNNMLGVILGNIELAMLKAGEDNILQPHLLEVRKAAQRSAELTQQLLAFARKQAIAPVGLDLNTAITGTLQMLHRLIGENIELRWLPGNGPFSIKMDPSQFDQMLINLCVNARDAINGAGTVTIETDRLTIQAEQCVADSFLQPGDFALLTVSDDGCGMDKETQAKIFEPFFTTKGLRQGTGLGLATVYGIVKQNNGFILVYSEPGQGTSFRIYLPWSSAVLTTTTPPGTDTMPPGNGETILVVEDERVLLDISTHMLENLGYKVLAADYPEVALRLAEEYRGTIDLLLTDVVLPEMNGREIEKSIRESNPGAACLFMSGYTANVISHHGVIDEGVLFIQKPFSMNDLAVKVRQAIDEFKARNMPS